MTTEKPRVWYKCTKCNFFMDDFREGDSLEGYATYCCYLPAEKVLVPATPEEIKEHDLNDITKA